MLSFHGHKVERLISKNVDIEIQAYLLEGRRLMASSAIGMKIGKNEVQVGWTKEGVGGD
jgi:hypothetical protein